MTNCINCEKELQPVSGMTTNYQYDNSLWIGLFGGYGMFVDNMVGWGKDSTADILKDADYEAVLCHECAHQFVETNPWVKKLFDPHKSHSHTQQYHIDHSDHFGWDYDEEVNKL